MNNIFKNNHITKEQKTRGANAKYFSFLIIKNITENMNEKIKIHDKFTMPINAEIAEISLTSPPPKEYGFLK